MFVIATLVSIGLSLVLASTIANPLADLKSARTFTSSTLFLHLSSRRSANKTSLLWLMFMLWFPNFPRGYTTTGNGRSKSCGIGVGLVPLARLFLGLLLAYPCWAC